MLRLNDIKKTYVTGDLKVEALKGIDLSSSKIEGIAVTIDDIKGAIIDQLQGMDLLYLIGVKIK